MRVWDIHPGYLSNQSLLGQHVEIHALHSIIYNGKRGYASHPETIRWQGRLPELAAVHNLTVREMTLRGFTHKSPLPPSLEPTADGRRPYVDSPAAQFDILLHKYMAKGQQGRIPLPENSSRFWAHHKYSVMARNYRYYKEMQAALKDSRDLPVTDGNIFIDRVLALMELETSAGALRNVTDHLWGYFKKEATEEEKSAYFSIPPAEAPAQVAYLFQLARKYRQNYLLHSTVFADI
jgi:uncharacterized protein YbgA (DUF1722 family)